MHRMSQYRQLTSYTSQKRLIRFPPQHRRWIRLEPLQTSVTPWNIPIYCKFSSHLQQSLHGVTVLHWKRRKWKRTASALMKSCYPGRNVMKPSRDVAESICSCTVRKQIECFLRQSAPRITQNESVCFEGLGQIRMQFDLCHTVLCGSCLTKINSIQRKALLPPVIVFFH